LAHSLLFEESEAFDSSFAFSHSSPLHYSAGFVASDIFHISPTFSRSPVFTNSGSLDKSQYFTATSENTYEQGNSATKTDSLADLRLIFGIAIGVGILLGLVGVTAYFVRKRKPVLTLSDSSGERGSAIGEMSDIGNSLTLSGVFQDFDAVFTIEDSNQRWHSGDLELE
jgi:hypothetical protein